MTSIRVGFGWRESVGEFYVTIEHDQGDEAAWVDADLYATWRAARITYEALTALIEAELTQTPLGD